MVARRKLSADAYCGCSLTNPENVTARTRRGAREPPHGRACEAGPVVSPSPPARPLRLCGGVVPCRPWGERCGENSQQVPQHSFHGLGSHGTLKAKRPGSTRASPRERGFPRIIAGPRGPPCTTSDTTSTGCQDRSRRFRWPCPAGGDQLRSLAGPHRIEVAPRRPWRPPPRETAARSARRCTSPASSPGSRAP